MDFEKLYQIHYQELFCFAFKLCRFEDEAKDLVHDSFAKLFEESKKNSSIDNPRHGSTKYALTFGETDSTKIEQGDKYATLFCNGKHKLFKAQKTLI